jgi:homoserine O-succinyltransferase/O-acetyltransferase
MPVIVEPHDSKPGLLHRASRCVTIGLVNNMPDEALKATERQFLSLLEAASPGILIRLSYFALPGIPRHESARRHINHSYASLHDLGNQHLDGLIVTGREPLSSNLMDEPYWDSFTRLVDWAQTHTHSTVWSCLAAHAAILHLDGIHRVKRSDKLFGIFDCARGAKHALTAGTPARLRLPHSRWNGVLEDSLRSCGYTVLTRSEQAGVDTFIKQRKALFVFFQGHPEYESDTLLREYRRDLLRYFKRETESCPLPPQNYFDGDTAEVLQAFRERAMGGRSDELLSEISAVLAEKQIENTWHSSAAGLYKNWLAYLCEQKRSTHRASRITARDFEPA